MTPQPNQKLSACLQVGASADDLQVLLAELELSSNLSKTDWATSLEESSRDPN